MTAQHSCGLTESRNMDQITGPFFCAFYFHTTLQHETSFHTGVMVKLKNWACVNLATVLLFSLPRKTANQVWWSSAALFEVMITFWFGNPVEQSSPVMFSTCFSSPSLPVRQHCASISIWKHWATTRCRQRRYAGTSTDYCNKMI